MIAAAVTHHRILIVEDDAVYAERLARNLKLDGFETDAAAGVDEAMAKLGEQTFDLILADLRMPGRGGLELLDELQRRADGDEAASPPVAILTSVNDMATAIEAMKRGAADYLTKEAAREEIALRLNKILRQDRLAHEVRRLRRSLDRYHDFGQIVGRSPKIEAVKRSIAEIAPSNVTVLISGETGVGKELVARAIHLASDRAGEAFVPVNCAALPDENMFLSDLFGHERGAFTGALARKRGHFEQADEGTLFLDEVGELGASAQARILRAVETLEFTRLGGERPVRCNARLVFATNKDLKEEVEAGRFRRDLYYRINVYPIAVPPLRRRPEDVAPLAEFFAARAAERHHLAPIRLQEDALDALRTNPWPGNVRELRNVIERLSIRLAGRGVGASDLRELDLTVAPSGADVIVLPREGISLDEAERSLVTQALERCEYNQARAAKLLHISVDRMNARVKKFDITHASWRVHK